MSSPRSGERGYDIGFRLPETRGTRLSVLRGRRGGVTDNDACDELELLAQQRTQLDQPILDHRQGVLLRLPQPLARAKQLDLVTVHHPEPVPWEQWQSPTVLLISRRSPQTLLDLGSS